MPATKKPCLQMYIRNPKTGRCIFKTGATAKKLSKRKASPKRKTLKKRKSSTYRYSRRHLYNVFQSKHRSGRPSPTVSALRHPVGARRVGGDGNVWKVIRAGDTQRWARA